MDTALQRAIKIAGGFTKLAALLGISKQAIMQWDEVPLDRVIAVEAATGVDRTELRPDVFNAPRPAAHTDPPPAPDAAAEPAKGEMA